MIEELTPEKATRLASEMCSYTKCSICPFDSHKYERAGIKGNCGRFDRKEIINKSEQIKQFCNNTRNTLLLMIYSDNAIRNTIIRKHLLKKGE